MSALTPARDIDAARRRAERIRIKARNVTEQYADLRALVDEAERNEDHLTLGYQSWTAYVSDLFGEEPLRLPRDERIPMVQMLADKGMSTRAIASVVGVTHETVAQDIKSPVRNLTPAAHERIDPRTCEVVPPPTYKPTDVTDWTPQEVDDLIDADERELEAWKASTVPAPPKVVGLDGKTYTRPEPKAAEPARRAALPPMVQSAGWDLTKTVDRIQRLADDDRFAGHQKEMAPHLRSHLTHAIEVCQDLLDRINNN